MGMSGDMVDAIAAGSTMVRVGTTLFRSERLFTALGQNRGFLSLKAVKALNLQLYKTNRLLKK